jgi:hypothetical protein
MARAPRRSEGEEPSNPANPTANPYVDWAWGPGRPYYFRPGLQPGPEAEQRMTLLLQLSGITAQDFVEGHSFVDSDIDRFEWQSSFRPLFAALTPDPKPEDVSWVLAIPTKRVSDIIMSDKVRRFVKSVTLGRPLDTQSLPPPRSKSPSKSPDRPKPERQLSLVRAPHTQPLPVVMGIIDDGICFGNQRFRNNGGTRVEHWWLMDGPTNNSLGGHVLDKSAIDPLLGLCTNVSGALNEDLFYRLVELIDFRQPNHKSAAWQASHGTHVMDLACGFDPAANRNDRPIVCVQLPTRVTAEVDNGNLFPYVVAAIDFIVGSALEIAADRGVPPMPVVINFSYGRYEGPHDGTHPIEAFIDWLVALCAPIFPLSIVLPTGNNFLQRIHAQFSFQRSLAETQTVPWRVLPDSRAETYVEIWLPPPTAGAGSFSVTLTTPSNQAFSINESQTLVPIPFGLLAYLKLPTARRVFYIILAPTADFDPAAILAQVGTYGIAITRANGSAVVDLVHAWVARDETIPGYPQAGRQSYFNDPSYRRFDYAGRDLETDDTATSVVKRRGTINSIATGASPIVMGGYLRKEMVPAKYSAAATVPPPPRWPEAMTPSDDSRVHKGLLAAGSRSNSRFAMAGTSVAAPQIAMMVADALATGGPGNRATVQNWATTAELGYPPGTPAMPPGERGGSGRIPTAPIVKLRRYEP